MDFDISNNVRNGKNILKSGDCVGSSALEVYEKCCERFGWDISKKDSFSKQEMFFLEDVSPEGYSIWCLEHNNIIKSNDSKWIKDISSDGTQIDEFWNDGDNHPYLKANGKYRVTFYKKLDNETKKPHYFFLGVFQLYHRTPSRYRNPKYAENSICRVFDRVSDTYPIDVKKLNNDDIDARLKMLRESKNNSESFIIAKDSLAMCYSMAPMIYYNVNHTCAKCGKEFVERYSNYDGIKGADGIYDLAKEFVKVGMNAEPFFYCVDCRKEFSLPKIAIGIKTSDEANYHITVPGKDANRISYSHVLRFILSRAENQKDVELENQKDVRLIKDTDRILSYKGLSEGELVDFNIGFTKIDIDYALFKVLGLSIKYDKQEVMKNIEFMIDGNNEEILFSRENSYGFYFKNDEEREKYNKLKNNLEKQKKEILKKVEASISDYCTVKDFIKLCQKYDIL